MCCTNAPAFNILHVLDIHVYREWATPCKKVPNSLSRCHTKRRIGVCGRAHPSFKKKKKKKYRFLKNGEKKNLKGQCCTKRRTCSHPSFGMTQTQDIRHLFAWSHPFITASSDNTAWVIRRISTTDLGHVLGKHVSVQSSGSINYNKEATKFKLDLESADTL